MARMIEVCKSNNYTDIETFVNDLIMEAYSANQVLEQLAILIISDFRIKDKQKADIFSKVAVSITWNIQRLGQLLLTRHFLR